MRLLSVGCHPVPCVQIEIYEERGSAYAHGATGLGEGGRKETGNHIYTASKMGILKVQSTAGSIRSWLISPRSAELRN